MKNVIRRILCWPMYIGMLAALIVGAFWGAGTLWENGVARVRLRKGSWPTRTWFRGWAGVTLGYGMVLSPDANETVVEHEDVHVEQFEGATIAGFVLGALEFAVVRSPLGVAAWLVCWVFCIWAVYFSATLVAWLRSEPNAYRGNALEEAAYNATAVKCRA
jgi:hypothetical protein